LRAGLAVRRGENEAATIAAATRAKPTTRPIAAKSRRPRIERAPQPLDKDVVHLAAAPIHRDAHAGREQDAGEGRAGELAALVGVEISGLPYLASASSSASTQNEASSMLEPPRQDCPARPIDHGDQVEETARQRDVRYVGRPHLVRPLDRKTA